MTSLWNEIYMFFVKYIFGGSYRTPGQNVLNTYQAIFGVNSSTNNFYTRDVQVTLWGNELSFGNYLSLLATTISMIFIFVLCCLFIYKLVRLVGGLLR